MCFCCLIVVAIIVLIVASAMGYGNFNVPDSVKDAGSSITGNSGSSNNKTQPST